MSISNVHARQILDSRGNPTVEVEVTLDDGNMYRAAVPSGASTGQNEACELRDQDKQVFLGKGVTKAVKNVKEIIGPKLVGMDPRNQTAVDDLMIAVDGTEFKSNLGANAILGVSMAVCRAGAGVKKVPLFQHINDLAGNPKMMMPVPCFNVINGGVHAGNFLALQEFFLIPVGAASFSEALRLGSETYHTLKGIIKEEYGIDSTAVGDEGGFAPHVKDPEESLQLLMKAIDKAGHSDKISIGLDAAASEFYNGSSYDLDFKNPAKTSASLKTPAEMVSWYEEVCTKYPIILLEDPFDESAFDTHAEVTKKVGKDVEVVGDDLYCTNIKFVKKGLEKGSTNAMLLKVNQIGTVSESLTANALCRENNWGVFVSHRSGETEDHFIADLTVGLSTGHLKTGAPCRSERNCKYNQLLRIEEKIGPDVPYAGYLFRTPWKA